MRPGEMKMRFRYSPALIGLALMAIHPASAQSTGTSGIKTETQERLETTRNKNLPFNLIGLFGLLGLLGLREPHREDSYHPSPVE